MIGDLFDSPWKILIVAVVLIVLFGSRKLPVAARSLGKSMRILKTEVSGLHADEAEPEAEAAPPAQPDAQQAITAQQQLTAQQQIDQLQQQIREMKDTPAGQAATVPADNRTQQPH
ncbi:MAG TPA: Sec-independent protein translocase subunit TatA [Streptosporangiaceae bacterium]|jgi:sec-independent protein translocase protein TatA